MSSEKAEEQICGTNESVVVVRYCTLATVPKRIWAPLNN